jgi:hypothetical protein
MPVAAATEMALALAVRPQAEVKESPLGVQVQGAGQVLPVGIVEALRRPLLDKVPGLPGPGWPQLSRRPRFPLTPPSTLVAPRRLPPKVWLNDGEGWSIKTILRKVRMSQIPLGRLTLRTNRGDRVKEKEDQFPRRASAPSHIP